MTPINYDFVISFMSFAAGVYMFCKIGGFSKKQYTPVLAALIVSTGIIAWAIVFMVSVSGIFEHPTIFYSKGWKGSWGYTSSRMFMAIMWGLTLLSIHFYAPKCRKEVIAKI